MTWSESNKSVVRSAADASHRNRIVSFKSDIQESLKLLDTKKSLNVFWKDSNHKHKSRKPSLNFVWKDSNHKHKSRNTNNDVSNRTRSKADYTDQHIGSRTRSKMHSINNLSVKNLFFPLHDAILFQVHGESQSQDLQLGVAECKAYHNVFMNTKYQVDFDRLLQLHMLDKTEKDNDMSWECHKVVDYCK
jgi:hypothetical protein